jgi:hypothetical protein
MQNKLIAERGGRSNCICEEDVSDWGTNDIHTRKDYTF